MTTNHVLDIDGNPTGSKLYTFNGELPDRWIFVFGSNSSGRHGKGAALRAVQKYGATMHRGFGLSGNSYAIPARHFIQGQISTLPLRTISHYIEGFKQDALDNHKAIFVVTRIGCGLAGYTDSEIAPLFAGANRNCVFPIEWREYLPRYNYHEGSC